MRLIAEIETRDGSVARLDRLDGIVSFCITSPDGDIVTFEVEVAELYAALDALAGHNSARAEPAKDAEAQARRDAAAKAWVDQRAAEAEAYIAQLEAEEEAALEREAALARERNRKVALQQLAELKKAQAEAPPTEFQQRNAGKASPDHENVEPLDLNLPPEVEAEIRANLGAAPFRPILANGRRWNPRFDMKAKPDPELRAKAASPNKLKIKGDPDLGLGDE